MNIQKNSSKTRSNRRVPGSRFVYPVGIAVCAIIAASATNQAVATRAVEGPGSTTTTPTVTSPCFAVRSPDRWGADVGAQPRCEHAFGATTSFGIEGGSPTGAAAANNHWWMCFDNVDTYRAWVKVQVGMPRCDGIAPTQQPGLEAEVTSPDPKQTTVHSPCFMSPIHREITIDEAWPVCSPSR